MGFYLLSRQLPKFLLSQFSLLGTEYGILWTYKWLPLSVDRGANSEILGVDSGVAGGEILPRGPRRGPAREMRAHHLESRKGYATAA